MTRDGEDGYRALFSNHDVVYIYHNRIDSIGDKRDSEERVFEAVEDALQDLIRIVKKADGGQRQQYPGHCRSWLYLPAPRTGRK